MQAYSSYKLRLNINNMSIFKNKINQNLQFLTQIMNLTNVSEFFLNWWTFGKVIGMQWDY